MYSRQLQPQSPSSRVSLGGDNSKQSNLILVQGSQTVYENSNFLEILIIVQGQTTLSGVPDLSRPRNHCFLMHQNKKSQELLILIHGPNMVYENKMTPHSKIEQIHILKFSESTTPLLSQ